MSHAFRSFTLAYGTEKPLKYLEVGKEGLPPALHGGAQIIERY
jgi:hypothetical protein